MIVYCITNTINGKKYVGKTRHTLNARKRGHKYRSQNIHAQSQIIQGWYFYDINTTLSVTDYINTLILASREKISKSRIGRIAWNTGIPMREETRIKISKTTMGSKGFWAGKRKSNLGWKNNPNLSIAVEES